MKVLYNVGAVLSKEEIGDIVGFIAKVLMMKQGLAEFTIDLNNADLVDDAFYHDLDIQRTADGRLVVKIVDRNAPFPEEVRAKVTDETKTE
mgnify:CR=1 FL=1